METNNTLIQVRGARVLVIPLKKTQDTQFIVKALDEHSQGVVKYVGPGVEGLKTGMVVYFGNQRNSIIIKGEPMLSMLEDNIIATETEKTSD